MTRSATDIMQEIVFAAVVDSLDALKSASRGVPNTLLRDIGAIHVNSTFADLPKELQAAITASVRTAFNRLLKEGYAIAPRDAAPPPRGPGGGQPPRGPGGQSPRPNRNGPPGGNRRGPPAAKAAPEVERKPKPRRPR
jgi:hypothetical protein